MSIVSTMENLRNAADEQARLALGPLYPLSMSKLGDYILQWGKNHPFTILSTISTLVYYWWQKRIPKGTVLELDLDTVPIKEAGTALAELVSSEPQLTMLAVISALDTAAKDSRIAGLVVRLGNAQLGIAQAQELKAAIGRFREAGKKTIAFAECFGEAQPSLVNYSIAGAFDSIYMVPCGDVNIVGAWLNVPFLKNTLEKIGVQVNVERRRSHKTAMHMFEFEKFTPEHREQVARIVGGVIEQIVQAIGKDRRMSEQRARELLANGPYSGQEAVDNGLIDGLAYRDQLYDEIIPRHFGVAAGKKPPLLFLSRYINKAKPSWSNGPVVAYISASGTILRGQSTLFDEHQIRSDTLSAAIRSAAAAKEVKAIVLRVDSGGGSYYASDIISREVQNAKKAGKKVVVSMGNVAASGGYYISQYADRILVSPATITGSIGIIYSKLIPAALWAKLGITFDHIEVEGKNAHAYSTLHSWSEEERLLVAKFIDRAYADFKGKVGDARSLSPEAVEELAQGKVWLGAAAVDLRLADGVGGIYEAIQTAKQLLGVAPTGNVTVKRWPGFIRTLKQLAHTPENSQEVSYRSPLSAVASFFRVVAVLGAMLPRQIQSFVTQPSGGLASADGALVAGLEEMQ